MASRPSQRYTAHVRRAADPTPILNSNPNPNQVHGSCDVAADAPTKRVLAKFACDGRVR